MEAKNPASKTLEEQLLPVLPRVQKPARYSGGELNQILKDWNSVKTHFAIVFPEVYDVGVPNLGVSILYDQINQREDTLAERAYAPWKDMESQMRDRGIPLYGLESKTPLFEYDIVGFSLPYETLYTNVLNILDLAQIPILAEDRNLTHPLVIAGGHACFNPEPMHAFIDAFVIGEGEEVIHEIIHTHQRWKQSSTDRNALLRMLSTISGVYVPALYRVDYHEEGTVKSILPLDESIPIKVQKRIVASLPKPLTRFIVPNIEVVHDRVAVEIMRGCTRGCRFCHAGMINRPVRERPVEMILEAIQEAIDYTGHEEVALLSLSSSDYTEITRLVSSIAEKYSERHLHISLPSLRIESFSVELMDQLKDSRAGGFTLAPEAATERMRQIINKPVSTEQLLDTAREIYRRGWTSIKLYFMIGHPSETLEDVRAIADLCWSVWRIGRSIMGGKAKVHAGVSTFVPKPHTPFQWEASDQISQVIEKQNLLKEQLRNPNFKLTWTDIEDTQLEAWLTRGDRRMSDVIFTAWKNGAKFDAWQESHNYQIWLNAFSENNMNPSFYSERVRPFDETLPWSHIDAGVSQSFLKAEAKAAKEGITRDDCRNQCYACGIMPAYASSWVDTWKCPPSKKVPVDNLE